MGLLDWLRAKVMPDRPIPNPVPPTPPMAKAAPPAPDDTWPTVHDLIGVLDALDCNAPNLWAAALYEPIRRRGIATPQRLGPFLATTMVETAGGAWLVERLDYTSAEKIMAAFGMKRFPTREVADRFVGKPRALANYAYANRNGNGPESSGDGWQFRGRGAIQITGRANYAAAAAAFGKPLDNTFLDWCMQHQGAAATAAWWWAAHGCNALADRGDTEGIRLRVNGGRNGLDEFRRLDARARTILDAA